MKEWFDDIPVLARQAPSIVSVRLREIGDNELADQIEAAHGGSSGSLDEFGLIRLARAPRPWQHTAHSFGYLRPPAAEHAEFLPIEHAGEIKADTSLKNSRVKITLDRLRVAGYPGSGMHYILFDFYAQNQASGTVEHLHFNATFRAREGEEAAIVGYPLFVGLNVGHEGLAFKCFTVNVKNQEDEAFLGFLDSDVFRAGLKLVETAQPAIAPLSELAFGLTKSIARRHRNVAVQDFYLGLDFSAVATRARLAEGSYIVVQVPESSQAVWNWRQWRYEPASGHIVNQADVTKLLSYNYLVFSLSRYEGS